MSDNIISYIITLNNEQLIDAINKTSYKDISNDLKSLNITGSDLLDLNDFQIVFKYRNALAKDRIKQLQELVNSVKTNPNEIFNTFKRTSSIRKIPSTSNSNKPPVPARSQSLSNNEQKTNFIREALHRNAANTPEIKNLLQGINNLTSNHNTTERKENPQNQVQSQVMHETEQQQVHTKITFDELLHKIALRRKEILAQHTFPNNKTAIKSEANYVEEELPEYVNIQTNEEVPSNSSEEIVEYVNEEFRTEVGSNDSQSISEGSFTNDASRDSFESVTSPQDTNNQITQDSAAEYFNLTNADDQPIEYWEADHSEPIYENNDYETNSDLSTNIVKTSDTGNDYTKTVNEPPPLPYRPKLPPLAKNVKVYKPSRKFRNSDTETLEETQNTQQEDQKTADTPDRNSGEYHPLPKLQQSEVIPEQDDYEVPISEISPKYQLEKHTFFKNVSRSEGNSLLKNTKQGSYLLRPSSASDNFAVLMINGATKIQNVPIMYENNEYSLKANPNTTPEKFNSLTELLDNYTKYKINGDVLIASTENWVPKSW